MRLHYLTRLAGKSRFLSVLLSAAGVMYTASGAQVTIPTGSPYVDNGTVYEENTELRMGAGVDYTGDDITLSGYMTIDSSDRVVLTNSTINSFINSSSVIQANSIQQEFLLDNVHVEYKNNITSQLMEATAVHISGSWGAGSTATIANSSFVLTGVEEDVVQYSVAIKNDSNIDLTVTNTRIESTAEKVWTAALRATNNSIMASGLVVNIVKSGEPGGYASSNIFNIQESGAISVSDSTVISSDYNILIGGHSDTEDGLNQNFVLDNVNLDNARNQYIYISGSGGKFTPIMSVLLKNGTHFHGSSFFESAVGTMNITLENASWTNAGNSDMGTGTLTLDGGSMLNFVTDTNEFDFFDLAATSVRLAQGAILMLDQEASVYGSGDVLNLITSSDFVNNGCLLVSSDGYVLDYDAVASANGSFVLTGNTYIIPEPATATLGLLGLAALVMVRRRVVTWE